MVLKKSVLVQKIIGFLVDSALIIYEPLKNSIQLFNRLFLFGNRYKSNWLHFILISGVEIKYKTQSSILKIN